MRRAWPACRTAARDPTAYISVSRGQIVDALVIADLIVVLRKCRTNRQRLTAVFKGEGGLQNGLYASMCKFSPHHYVNC
jgi:hypothetical protein